MSTHDLSGRPWAKLSELRDGDIITLDGGFTCAEPGVRCVCSGKQGLYFLCEHGYHYLSGQADDGEHLVGVYRL